MSTLAVFINHLPGWILWTGIFLPVTTLLLLIITALVYKLQQAWHQQRRGHGFHPRGSHIVRHKCIIQYNIIGERVGGGKGSSSNSISAVSWTAVQNQTDGGTHERRTNTI
ncbi:uncharacterized protein LOC130566261 isoform X1 [Triplophysa rosa]|uniref:uncharacterized protein LOC130566261 isoform X1 n=1 Tax=Triplophysa rosa TaxID=992332 RepID=UPI002545D8D5|nr:uncharacterized protein LOC130566261 isoform X1 [Triplophysa rosa]